MEYKKLHNMYIGENRSVSVIAKAFNCSENKVNYWLKKYAIQKRSISEAVYLKHNPEGDPFKVKVIKSLNEALLMGIGLGLYWGEGTKSNKNAIRLGNTNPSIIIKFIEFLTKIYGIEKTKLKFGLQIFNDTDPIAALEYWSKELVMPKAQFQKVVVTPSRGPGTYRRKMEYGVLTVYYHNKKLRDLLCGALEKL